MVHTINGKPLFQATDQELFDTWEGIVEQDPGSRARVRAIEDEMDRRSDAHEE